MPRIVGVASGRATLQQWRSLVRQEWTPEELIESWTLVTGALGLDTLFSEIGKLNMVRALGLPEELFADASDVHSCDQTQRNERAWKRSATT